MPFELVVLLSFATGIEVVYAEPGLYPRPRRPSIAPAIDEKGWAEVL